jgi:iron(III) transport system substrate-binding protein
MPRLNMKEGVMRVVVLVVIGLFGVVACASPAAPSAAPTAPAAPAPPTTAPAAPTAAPAAPPTAAAASGQQTSASGAPAPTWDQIVADAHTEGTLVIDNGSGPAGQSVLDAFQAQYPWLQLQVTALQASQFTPRVLTEQRNGLYAWDMLMGAGFNQTQQSLVPAGAVGDVRPYLAELPSDVTDDSKWAGGFAWYRSDTSPDSLVTDLAATWGVYVNREQLPADQLSSITQLADPQFKGKFVIYNPNSAGAGSQTLANIMSHTDEAFIHKILVDQAPAYTSDNNQAAQFVTEGRYPIAIGVTASSLQPYVSQGVGTSVEPLREQANQFMHAAGFTVLKNAPHPNAMKVFLSWFLSQEGQTAWNRGSVTAASRRLDVGTVNQDAVPDYAHISDYKVIFDTPSGDQLLASLLAIAAQDHP